MNAGICSRWPPWPWAQEEKNKENEWMNKWITSTPSHWSWTRLRLQSHQRDFFLTCHATSEVLSAATLNHSPYPVVLQVECPPVWRKIKYHDHHHNYLCLIFVFWAPRTVFHGTHNGTSCINMPQSGGLQTDWLSGCNKTQLCLKSSIVST